MVPVLQGEKVRLRGFSWADFAAFSAMWQEPEVAQFIPFAPVSPTQSWARFNGNTYSWVRNGFGGWAVVDGSDGFLGTVTFFRRAAGFGEDYDRAIQAGWVFAARGRGQGNAGEAVNLAHSWLDMQHFGGRSVCGMDPGHAASIRVATKTGYRLLRRDVDTSGPVQLMERIAPV